MGLEGGGVGRKSERDREREREHDSSTECRQRKQNGDKMNIVLVFCTSSPLLDILQMHLVLKDISVFNQAYLFLPTHPMIDVSFQRVHSCYPQG